MGVAQAIGPPAAISEAVGGGQIRSNAEFGVVGSSPRNQLAVPAVSWRWNGGRFVGAALSSPFLPMSRGAVAVDTM